MEQWAEYAGNKKVAQFTDREINAYLVYMPTEHVPRQFGRSTRALSPKSLWNIWITMCSFFTWARTESRIESPMKSVLIPRFQKVDVEPFTQEEIEKMLKACTYLRELRHFHSVSSRWPVSRSLKLWLQSSIATPRQEMRLSTS